MRAIAGEKLVGDFSKEPAGVELYSHSGDTEADFDLYLLSSICFLSLCFSARPSDLFERLIEMEMCWEQVRERERGVPA
jgi:hypothetical protein